MNLLFLHSLIHSKPPLYLEYINRVQSDWSGVAWAHSNSSTALNLECQQHMVDCGRKAKEEKKAYFSLWFTCCGSANDVIKTMKLAEYRWKKVKLGIIQQLWETQGVVFGKLHGIPFYSPKMLFENEETRQEELCNSSRDTARVQFDRPWFQRYSFPSSLKFTKTLVFRLFFSHFNLLYLNKAFSFFRSKLMTLFPVSLF